MSSGDGENTDCLYWRLCRISRRLGARFTGQPYWYLCVVHSPQDSLD